MKKAKILVGATLTTAIVFGLAISATRAEHDGPICERDPFDHDRSNANKETAHEFSPGDSNTSGGGKATAGGTSDNDDKPSFTKELWDSAKERAGATIGGAIGGAVSGSRGGLVGIGLGALGGSAAGAIGSAIHEAVAIRNNIHNGTPPPTDDSPPGME